MTQRTVLIIAAVTNVIAVVAFGGGLWWEVALVSQSHSSSWERSSSRLQALSYFSWC